MRTLSGTKETLRGLNIYEILHLRQWAVFSGEKKIWLGDNALLHMFETRNKQNK